MKETIRVIEEIHDYDRERKEIKLSEEKVEEILLEESMEKYYQRKEELKNENRKK